MAQDPLPGGLTVDYVYGRLKYEVLNTRFDILYNDSLKRALDEYLYLGPTVFQYQDQYGWTIAHWILWATPDSEVFNPQRDTRWLNVLAIERAAVKRKEGLYDDVRAGLQKPTKFRCMLCQSMKMCPRWFNCTCMVIGCSCLVSLADASSPNSTYYDCCCSYLTCLCTPCIYCVYQYPQRLAATCCVLGHSSIEIKSKQAS